jgi:hypothetical protein
VINRRRRNSALIENSVVIGYDIVTRKHGSTIEVDSEVGEFTSVMVQIN